MLLIIYKEDGKSEDQSLLAVDNVSGKPMECGLLPPVGSVIDHEKFTGTITNIVWNSKELLNRIPSDTTVMASVTIKLNGKVKDKRWW